MTPYAKIYMQYFDYGIEDFIPCELCGSKSVDIHHINGRGKGKNIITNLMAVCRKHHTMIHDSKISKSEVQYIHNSFLNGQRKIFIK